MAIKVRKPIRRRKAAGGIKRALSVGRGKKVGLRRRRKIGYTR